MAVDEQSSQDSTLIDDDLVAALGFEPVTTIDAPAEDQTSTDDDVVAEADGRGDDADADVSSNGELNGFSIGEVDASGDAVAEDAAGVIEDRGSFFDLDTNDSDSADDSETLDDLAEAEVEAAEVIEVAEVEDDSSADADEDSVEALVEESSVDEALEEQSADDLEIERSDAEALDDVEAPLDEMSLDDVLESDLDSVPSIADLDIDADATAPVSMIDLDTPDADVDIDAVLDTDTDTDTEDVIDLEVVDLSDSPLADDLAMQGFVDDEVHQLADADSVFADSTPVLDPPVFDDVVGHPATETVDQVGSGLLDLDTADETVGTAAVATAATATATKGRRRLRARKSRRVIRHIDPWSVLTFSVLFHMVVFAALLLSSVLVWNAAIASGMVENVESFIQELGDYETFEINADVMFKAAIVIAGMLTLASSVLVVLLTVVFNLISDLVGGIRVTVIEEETVRVPIDKKRSKARNE